MPQQTLLIRLRFYAALIFACLTTNLTAQTKDERSYRESIDKIGGEISQISRNLNANKKLLKTEQDKLFELEKSLSQIAKKIEQTNRSIESKQLEISKLDQQLLDSRSDQKTNREALRRLLESRYQQGDTDYLKQFLNQKNPYAVGRLNNYHSYFSAAYRQRFAQLQEQIKATQTLHAEQQKSISELVSQREEQTRLQTEWQGLKKHRANTVARLNQKVGASETKLEKLKKDRGRLNSLLEQIAKQAAELKRLEQERAKQLEKERAQQLTRDEQQPAPIVRTPVKGGFLKQKGRLSVPVNGSVRTRYGNRLPESGMRSEGMFFNTDGPQPVRSIFRGRVLFADFLKGYGLLIIVDHGDDHISLYGHNELLYKRVGDTVETNQVIAKSGVTGGLKSTGLYFEIRKSATPVNPGDWLN